MIKLKSKLEKRVVLLGLTEDKFTIIKEIHSMTIEFRNRIETELSSLGVERQNIKTDTLKGCLIFTSKNLSGNLLLQAEVVNSDNEATITMTTRLFEVKDKYGVMPSQN